MRKPFPRLAPAVILLGWLAAPLAAADYHVSPSGSDSNDGLGPQSAFR